jgi:plasmid stabilization system protein ParE
MLTEGGAPVVSRAHPRDLEALARGTGGTFAVASNPAAAAAMAAAFRSGAAFGKGGPAREPVSRAAWPLAGAVAAWAAWTLPRRRGAEAAS